MLPSDQVVVPPSRRVWVVIWTAPSMLVVELGPKTVRPLSLKVMPSPSRDGPGPVTVRVPVPLRVPPPSATRAPVVAVSLKTSSPEEPSSVIPAA